MATTVDALFEEARKLPPQDVEDLLGRLALLSVEPASLEGHPQVVETLRSRADGPFEPLDSNADRQAMKERVIAKGEALLGKLNG